MYNVDCIVIKKMTHSVMCHMDTIFNSYDLKNGKVPSSWYGPGKVIEVDKIECR